MTTVPPSGTLTVVPRLMVEKLGCCRNVWNRTSGGPVVVPAPGPKKICGTDNVTGFKVTRPDMVTMFGFMAIRTKRRSADTTGCTVRLTPVGIGVLAGEKNMLPNGDWFGTM